MTKNHQFGKNRVLGRNLIVLTFAVAFLAAANVRAEYLSDYYYEKNQDAATLEINDNNGVTWQVNSLFNWYFWGLEGDNSYASSNDLYAARGVKEGTETWISTGGSEFHASALSTMHGNTLSVVFPGGTTPYSWDFGFGENQLLGGSVQPLGIPGGTPFEWMLTSTDVFGNNGGGTTTWSSNAGSNADGMIHMIALDVSDLMLQKITDMENYQLNVDGTGKNLIYRDGDWYDYYAYMLCWEDLDGRLNNCDFDYQDMVTVISYIQPASATTTATPEPATLAVLGLGLVGLGLTRIRRQK